MSANTHQEELEPDGEAAMLDPAEADEEIPSDHDAPMDSDSDDAGEGETETLEELQLQNDSVAHFDSHTDSIFSIAQHPRKPQLIATGGGDDVAYIFDATPSPSPVLPASYQSGPIGAREGLQALAKLEGHKDSITAITFTLPDGEFVVTAGLDGQLRAWHGESNSGGAAENPGTWRPVGSAQEVDEINWLVACPHPDYPNTIALGANDGSVWVYTVSADPANPLAIVQAYYLHTASCTAGAWTPSGNLLASVSEDGSLYVWDVFGDAAGAGLIPAAGGQAVVGLTAADERFRVDAGLYSVAVSPGGALAAVGGGDGQIHVIGLPRFGTDKPAGSTAGTRGAGAKSKVGGGKQAGGPKAGGPTGAAGASGQGQAGQILASLHPQSESVESIAFAQPPLTLMATGSVDGSIALFDCAHRFAVRRHIQEAHEGETVIKVEFAQGGTSVTAADSSGWLLTSCGNDGTIKQWDTRGGTAAAANGLVAEWNGHRGGGEGGGVLGFVQGGGSVVTAGDDGVSLVFPASASR